MSKFKNISVLFLFFIIFQLFSLKSFAADTIIRNFTNSTSDGRVPCNAECQLIQVGDIFYGMTEGGGSLTSGTLFKMNTDGTGFSILKSFGGGVGDGYAPLGFPTIDGSVIYGMTYGGGLADWGVIFKINTNGTGFTVMHEFGGGTGDGIGPRGSLLQIGSTLYGMTTSGGANSAGVIFKINTDGTGFSILHKFTGTPTDGSSPDGSLIEYNGKLYGFGYDGGTSDKGTIFSYDVASTTYTTLHNFAGATTDGQNSSGNLTFNTSNSRLYGMTNTGGANDLGTIFYYQTSEPTPTPTGAPSSTPTPTTTSNSSSNSSSNQSSQNSNSSNTCNSQEPSSAPNLFQVDANNTTATLYFAPAGKPYNGYLISYGNGQNNQEYGASFNQSDSSGAIKFTVSNLKSNSTYSFKVRGTNGCAAGPWSKNLSIKTTQSKISLKHFYTNSLIDYTIGYTIPNIINSITKKSTLVQPKPPVQVNKKPTTKSPKLEAKTQEVKKVNQSLWTKIMNLF